RARWYAAGGVRDAADLLELRELGLHGALLASALHDGRLDAAQLRRLAH
ncbi:MAG: histidine biosynthesis protein, partial [Betaproteobacteria bacterium]|nr:histidine biosynthesis protein [Betaproteobacteria bacterium]